MAVSFSKSLGWESEAIANKASPVCPLNALIVFMFMLDPHSQHLDCRTQDVLICQRAETARIEKQSRRPRSDNYEDRQHNRIDTQSLSRRKTVFRTIRFAVGVSAYRPLISYSAPLSQMLLPTTLPLTLLQAVDIIRERCDPSFVEAVKSSGRFLYRGERALNADAALMRPKPDLLELDTYASDKAFAYFKGLEKGLMRLRAKVSPSNGHIGVSRPEAARTWGDVVSIWPLGQPLHFVWPKDRDDFYPGLVDENGAKYLGGAETCNIDVGLAIALESGKEILFASEEGSDFIAIDARLDDGLRTLLNVR